MLKEAKQWVAALEKTLNDMAEEYDKTVEEKDKVFEASRTSCKLRLEEGEFDEEDDDGEED